MKTNQETQSDTDTDLININDWMVTHSGRKFSPSRPEPDSITIRDIAKGLARTPRFAGQTTNFYSVAEHSIMCSEMCTELPMRFQALMHDATEAYLGDLCRAVKILCPDYREVERKVWNAICTAFDLDNTCYTYVKEVDKRMLVTEKKLLIRNPIAAWKVEQNYQPYDDITFLCLAPDEAETMFMQVFMECAPVHIIDRHEERGLL